MKLRFGAAGRSSGAFIGAATDRLARLAAGCFTRDTGKNLETAAARDADDVSRVYRERPEKKAARPDWTAPTEQNAP